MDKTNNTVKELDEELDIEIQQRLININQYSRYLNVYTFGGTLGSFDDISIQDICIIETKETIVRFIREDDKYIVKVRDDNNYHHASYSISSKSKYDEMVDFIYQELNLTMSALVLNDLLVFLMENSPIGGLFK